MSVFLCVAIARVNRSDAEGEYILLSVQRDAEMERRVGAANREKDCNMVAHMMNVSQLIIPRAVIRRHGDGGEYIL